MQNNHAVVRYLARVLCAVWLVLTAFLGQFVTSMPPAADRGPLVRYFGRLWWTIDVLCNVVRGGDVETMSSAMGRAIEAGARCLLCKLLCGLLDLRWKNHCVHNIMTPLNQPPAAPETPTPPENA